MSDIYKDYFEWLCKHINYEGRVRTCKKVLELMNGQDFIYENPRDGNRYEDGIDLRYRYGYENHISYPEIADTLDTRICSIFEMMVALAIRIDEHIMYDAEKGDCAGRWFWEMYDNLGLKDITNRNFNERYGDILEILDRFVYREYEPDGEGGLFKTADPTKNMLEEEIWYQMMDYLRNKVE